MLRSIGKDIDDGEYGFYGLEIEARGLELVLFWNVDKLFWWLFVSESMIKIIYEYIWSNLMRKMVK